MANDNIRALDQKVFIAPQSAKDDIATPAFDFFWRSSGAPADTVNYTQSSMLDPEGQAPESVKTSTEYQMEAERDYADYSFNMFKKAIHGVETLTDVTGADIQATASGFDSGASDAFADLIVGDHFWVSGFANNDINGGYIIATKTDDNTVTTAQAPAATEAAGASVTVFSRKVTSGLTRYYDTLQERLPYDSGAGGIGYQTYYNGLINAASLTIPEADIITTSGTWLIGNKLDSKDAVAGQTDNASVRSDSYSSDNIYDFWVNDDSKKCYIRSGELSIDNQYETSDAAGCSGREFGKGSISVTFSGTSYTNSANPYEFKDFAANSTDISFAFGLKSNDGLTETVYKMPRCKSNNVTTSAEANLLNTSFELNAQGSKAESTTLTIYTNV
jgi:hypothetical protein